MRVVGAHFLFFFFFKQKTAYEMRISDWSSDVCSSDLIALLTRRPRNADVVALSYCRLLVLSAADFRRLLDADPELRRSIDRVARRRLGQAEIGRASCRERVCQYV